MGLEGAGSGDRGAGSGDRVHPHTFCRKSVISGKNYPKKWGLG